MRATPLGMRLFKRPAVVVAGGGAFTPASISGLNFWLEADPTKLYTDLGSTLVSADGQAVEQANDKSTSARNTSQTVSGQRPLYKTDLSKPSLLFDGTDDHLDTSTGLAWVDGSGQHWFAISCRPAQTASAREIAVILSSGYLGDIYHNASAHMEIQNVASGFEEDAQAGLVAGTDVVIIGTVTTSQLEAFVDNVSGGATALSGSLKTSTGQMVVGGQNSFFSGPIFGVCHGSGTLTSTERGNLHTYMAGLHP